MTHDALISFLVNTVEFFFFYLPRVALLNVSRTNERTCESERFHYSRRAGAGKKEKETVRTNGQIKDDPRNRSCGMWPSHVGKTTRALRTALEISDLLPTDSQHDTIVAQIEVIFSFSIAFGHCSLLFVVRQKFPLLGVVSTLRMLVLSKRGSDLTVFLISKRINMHACRCFAVCGTADDVHTGCRVPVSAGSRDEARSNNFYNEDHDK